ncbi:MAG: metallophosphoesterase [Candidatus Obscuribacterales bacterium]
MPVELRKLLLNKTTAYVGLGLLGIGAGAWAYARREAYDYSIDFVTIDTTDGEALRRSVGNKKTLKILHISDLHLAGNENPKKLSFLQYMTEQDFDLIFLTGDIFEHDESVRLAPFLLCGKPRLGAYAVLGNHDYYRYSYINKTLGRMFKPLRHPRSNKRDVTPLVAALEDAGYRVMRNEVEHHRPDAVSILGMDYPSPSKQTTLELASEIPEDHLRLALFHMPRALGNFVDARVDVGFAGHTHGGQVRIPGFGPLITDSELARSEACGVVRRGETRFHISRGMGSDPKTNFRFFCPPVASVVDIVY